jgi:hypothetical protein
MKLLPGRSVKAFNLRNKNDAATHRRSGGRWLKFRTMRINGLRDLLAEYGEVMSARRAGFTKTSEILARLSGSLPAAVAAMGARRRSARAGSSPLQAGQQGILGMCSIHLRGRCAGRDWRGDSETAPVASGPETDETSASLP